MASDVLMTSRAGVAGPWRRYDTTIVPDWSTVLVTAPPTSKDVNEGHSVKESSSLGIVCRQRASSNGPYRPGRTSDIAKSDMLLPSPGPISVDAGGDWFFGFAAANVSFQF